MNRQNFSTGAPPDVTWPEPRTLTGLASAARAAITSVACGVEGCKRRRPPPGRSGRCVFVAERRSTPPRSRIAAAGGALGGLPIPGGVAIGGGGVVGVIGLLLVVLLGGGLPGGGALGWISRWRGRRVRALGGLPHGRGCQPAGRLSHRRRRQQRAGVLGRGARRLRGDPDRLLRRGRQHRVRERKLSGGPFYCPADQRVYIDLGFFDELEQDLAPTVGPSPRHT